MKENYPASRRKGHVETLEYAERERLFDKGMTRDQMNDLMQRLQGVLGSKNKLARAIFDRPNAASRVKQLVDGGTRYTDNTIERILDLAKRNGIPRVVSGEVAPASAPEPAAPVDETGATIPDATSTGDEPTESMQVADHREDHVLEDAGPDDPADIRSDSETVASPAPEPEIASEDPAVLVGVADHEPSNPADAFLDDVEPVAPPVASDVSGANIDWLHGVNMRRTEIQSGIETLARSIDERQETLRRLNAEIADLERRKESAANSLDDIDRALAILHTI